MSTASDIIDALGGSAALSRDTGFPLTTIESWKAANFIPEWRQPAILAVAAERKPVVRIKAFPPKEARNSRSQDTPERPQAAA